MRRQPLIALVAAAFSGATPIAARAQGTPLTLLGYHATAPANWVPRKPSSSFRLAQFVVPGPDSATDAEVVVFFFGASQGGNIEANLERWRGQFSTPDGSPVRESVTTDSTGAFPLTVAEYTGTYRRGIGMGSADSVRTGQTLVAAIAETPHGTMFIQLFGPDSVVAKAHDAFVRFVKAIK